ncbi:DUF1772-domain-containing protein [Lepidopterella palustris CBS 459.81]|uniref:DUF1772-domain-containing protein n=1 Tax=Lepidopterella palustris CBS 459.81 TaxID=1314670 RepID=A0A8E2JFK6_9PEZI|nr:DUF1772-domain-containing protein [Lepidopterella palustris CBS 459.81]
MAEQLSTPIRVAQVVGLTCSAALAGYIGGFSIGTVPSLKFAPAHAIAKQWQTAYEIGKSTAPFVALTAGLTWSYLATQGSMSTASKQPLLFNSNAFALYSASAVLVTAIVPFTLIVMKPTNDKLHAKADASEESKAETDETVDELMNKWYWLNVVRASLPGVGAVVGAMAVVGL